MIALVLCLLAWGSTYKAGKRSLGLGLVVLLFWGYFYGIVRANLLATFTYFVFDAALVGFYCSQKMFLSGGDRRTSAIQIWCWILMLWPVVVLIMPFQPLLVSLVGLRGSILFIPMLMAGSRLRQTDLQHFTLGLAVLNLMALVFGGGEYFLGLERFFPHNPATLLIYGSNDVAGGFSRIPAIFSTAHLYGGTMVATVPYLITGWEYAVTRRTRWLMLMGTGAAFLGVLLSATRTNFAVCCGLIVMTMMNSRMSMRKRVWIAVFVLVFAGFTLRNTRFQRFKSLSDTDYVEDRISGSVNRSFFEVLLEYPMGNGLGGGGTSIPYFLSGQVRNPVGMENEYARILLEQGVIGLLLWVGFVLWFFSRFSYAFARGPWSTGRRLIWYLSVLGFISGAIGTGMLTGVPQTAIFLLGIGFISTPMRSEAAERRSVGPRRVMVPQPASVTSV